MKEVTQRWAVYVMCQPTPWQTSSEAIYGPFNEEECDRFIDWVAQQLVSQYQAAWQPRVASFRLQAQPREHL